jgi:hypothetical protein
MSCGLLANVSIMLGLAAVCGSGVVLYRLMAR